MLPQLAVGGETPTPRKEMADSAMMKAPTFSDAATMMGASEFGMRWASMMRGPPAPGPQHTREHVAVQLVCAEPVGRGRWGEAVSNVVRVGDDAIDLVRPVGRERRQRGQGDHDEERAETEHREMVAAEAAPDDRQL